jgi:hypothetical protein
MRAMSNFPLFPIMKKLENLICQGMFHRRIGQGRLAAGGNLLLLLRF